MISRISARWRWLRKKFSRAPWTARLLGNRPPAPGPGDEPGLILIQIDGLSHSQFERALASGRLPFLAKLLRQEHFSLEHFYSGVPSTTPAVQAEIFYGQKACVPGFHFLDREAGKDRSMYDAESAAAIEAELLEKNPDPLLKDAHAYSNIFRAGAAKTRYCSQDFAARQIFDRLHPYRWAILLVLYFPRIIRIVLLALVELFISLFDVVRGLANGFSISPEIAFVPARVAVCVVLREAIRFRVLLDIESGVPFVQANFLGYDEQSHRRGPDSAFAHWTLLGIDRAIRDFHKAGLASDRRDYELMVYSDHGQEKVAPFGKATGTSLEKVAREAFATGPLADSPVWMREVPVVIEGIIDRCRKTFGFNRHSGRGEAGLDAANQTVVTAMGPLGHIYFPKPVPERETETYARRLVDRGVPMVLIPGGDGTARVLLPRGWFELPADAAEILGSDHPFLREAAEDLAALFRCRYAGDMMICGWRKDGNPVSFPAENGAHAGPGPEETHGFLLLPDRLKAWHVSHLEGTAERVRGGDLGQIVRHFLAKDSPPRKRAPRPPREPENLSLRVMTYNIHSCVGIDGKNRPERVARVINRFDPDFVGVQEVDCHRRRSGTVDQALAIGERLEMDHVFHALLEEDMEKYGIGVFSKYPFEIRRKDILTPAGKGRLHEARGAIWTTSELPGLPPLHFINTHFGLSRRERHEQMEKLLGADWIGAVPEDEPLVVCGDFNSGSRSEVMTPLGRRLRDVRSLLPGARRLPTFPSVVPLLGLDHVFVSPHFTVRTLATPRNPNARLASDHLPLCVEITLEPNPCPR